MIMFPNNGDATRYDCGESNLYYTNIMVNMVTPCSLHPSKIHTPRIYKYPAAAPSSTIARLIICPIIMAKTSLVVLCALVAVLIQAQMSMAVPTAYGQLYVAIYM